MSYINFRFLSSALCAVSVVCGAIMDYGAVLFAMATVLLALAKCSEIYHREIRTDMLDFYGTLLVGAAFVFLCFYEEWWIAALAVFMSLGLTVETQFALVGLHLFSTTVKLSVVEVIASLIMPIFTLAIVTVYLADSHEPYLKWMATTAFMVEVIAQYLFLKRIKTII